MKAVVCYKPGKADNLIIEERPQPLPASEQVLVRVRAFGLNRSELMTRKGLSPAVIFPRVLGIECVGEVEQDPSGIYEKGQQVMAFMGGMGRDFDGSYAEYTVLPKQLLYPFQSKLPWEILGAIPEMYQTVHGSLFLALEIKEGETLMIRGGSSSVGMLASRVAAMEGLTVLTTTRDERKEKLLLDNGASLVLVDDGLLSENIHMNIPEGVDKVLELVGASTLKDSLKCLRPGGTACMSGMLSESWILPDFEPMDFIPATVRLTVYDSGKIRSPLSVFQVFIQSIESGQMQLKPSRTFQLDQIVSAHECMENNLADGKIVVLTE